MVAEGGHIDFMFFGPTYLAAGSETDPGITSNVGRGRRGHRDAKNRDHTSVEIGRCNRR